MPPIMPSQVKLYLPADLEGGVALRAEADGFWSRAASSMLARLMHLAGYRSSVDEYFFQDSWRGPQRKVWTRDVDRRCGTVQGGPAEFLSSPLLPSPSATQVDQLLLFFGDPLQLVDVPWTPTTLVQDWQLT